MLRLIARGLSNAEIGQELYISDATVKTHITHILQKLNLRDRVQALSLPTRRVCSRLTSNQEARARRTRLTERAADVVSRDDIGIEPLPEPRGPGRASFLARPQIVGAT